MEKEIERNNKKRINEAIKELLVWIIGVATLAIMSEQLSEIFFSTWLGSFIEGVTPNILFILFGLSIYWCTQMLRGKHGAWRKPFFILAVALGVLYVFSDVHFVEAAVLLSPVNIGIGQGHITLVFFIPLILLVLTGSLYNALVLFGFLQSPYLMLFIGFLLFISAPYIIFLIRRLVNLFKKKANSAALSREGLFKYDRFDPKNNKPHVGRTQMIEAIVEQVKLLQHSKSSFTIGIEGGWGSGKTTLLEGIKERLRDKTDEYGNHIEIVEFSPWAYPDGKNLSVEFLYELKGVLTRYSLRARFVVNAYINALAENTNFIQAIIRLLFPHESLQKVKEKLSGLILLHRVKLVVVIDDLDRLDENEIAEVFRLLRNTGDLPNMVYLVAYDRLHVESIGQHNPAETSNSRFGSGYLDKVINVELNINSYNRDLLFGEFLYEAIKLMKKSEYFMIDIDAFQSFDSLSYKHNRQLRVIKTERDKVRIMNSLLFRLQQILLSFPDKENQLIKLNPQIILLLELIRASDSKLYMEIMKKEIFDDGWKIKRTDGDKTLLTAFADSIEGHTNIQYNGIPLEVAPSFIIDYYFIQSQAAATLLNEINKSVFFNTQGLEINYLSDLFRKDKNDIDDGLRLLIKDKLIGFLNNDDWAIIQAQGLISIIMIVIRDRDMLNALLPSIIKFCKIIFPNEPSNIKRITVVELLLVALQNKRMSTDFMGRYNNYDICFCNIFEELKKSENMAKVIPSQVSRVEQLLSFENFADALVQLPFFKEEGYYPDALVILLKNYIESITIPNKFSAFQERLLIRNDKSIKIGDRSFPIGILYPKKEMFANYLNKTKDDTLSSLGKFISDNSSNITEEEYGFEINSNSISADLLRKIDLLFQV